MKRIVSPFLFKYIFKFPDQIKLIATFGNTVIVNVYIFLRNQRFSWLKYISIYWNLWVSKWQLGSGHSIKENLHLIVSVWLICKILRQFSKPMRKNKKENLHSIILSGHLMILKNKQTDIWNQKDPSMLIKNMFLMK